ncbi:hypothetical protein ACQPTN_24850 [Bradyrhizobium sp. 13971]
MSERFQSWCRVVGQHALPAAPWVVAAFIREHAGLTAELLWAEIAAIDQTHEELGYAPPGRSSVALKAFSEAHSVDAPRSWRKEEQELFRMLPWGIQQTVLRREAERDRAVCQAKTEVSELRNHLRREANAEAETAA